MLVFKSNTQMRKLSPHVTIYRFPLAALTSITNRLTGLYLSGAFVAVGITSMTSYQMPTHPFLESVTAGCLCYHTLGGIRHYVWDWKPSLMTNTIARSSSVGLLATSIGFTATYMYLKTNPPVIK
jgi:succinate dehydrogenase (ubiquinone) cytochrome b560 subunit|tara:strand:+ start:1395 stop:1769 length:375 start_codon:yes stop_codon:yes gene_type:complete